MSFGGGGSYSAPDTSAYERQLAEQREATAKAEAEAAALKKANEDAATRARQGRSSLIKTGAGGDETTTSVKRKTLLGV